MRKDTVDVYAPLVKQKPTPPLTLRGVPKGLLCRAIDVRETLGIAKETWQLWRDAGLETVGDVGSDAELVFTDVVFRFFERRPIIGRRKRRPKT